MPPTPPSSPPPRLTPQPPPRHPPRHRHRRRRTLPTTRLLLRLALVLSTLIALQHLLSGLTTTGPLPRSILLLTAHPDDEVMFFSPSLLALIAAGVEVWALCLSTGDADGLGRIRSEELLRAYNVLGVESRRVTLLDHEEMRDGMEKVWRTEVVVGAVEEVYRRAGGVDALITFDHHGISSHPNHIACNRAAHALSSRSLFTSIYTLHSPTLLLAKYASLPSALFQTLFPSPASMTSIIGGTGKEKEVGEATTIRTLASPRGYLVALAAMRQHKSQLVWFRWLYVVFSQLMFANVLVRI